MVRVPEGLKRSRGLPRSLPRKSDAAEQILESRIGAQWIKSWSGHVHGQPGIMFLVSFLQTGKDPFFVPQFCILGIKVVQSTSSKRFSPGVALFFVLD